MFHTTLKPNKGITRDKLLHIIPSFGLKRGVKQTMFKNPTLLYFCSTFILFYYSFYCSALLLSTYSTIIDIILLLPSLLNYDEFSIFATDKCTPLVREITFEVRLIMLVLVANFDNVIRLFIMSRADRRSQIPRFFWC